MLKARWKDLAKIRTQVIWNRLLALVEEQAQVLIRTAFSPTVREAGDLSAGVFDRSGDMIAQAVTGTPGHVNAMAAAVKIFLKKYPLLELRPGDVLITNDPWDGTGHLNDFTVVTPCFKGESAIALFASTTHIADVGGLGFGPDGRQVFEEGINIPISHLFRAGALNETLMEIVKTNVRDPLSAEGDLYSLTACNQTGVERLLEMMKEFEIDDIDAVAAVIKENSRAAMVEEIRNVPPGVYENRMRIDGYDSPVDLHCKMTVTEDGIELDWSGTSGVSDYGINVPIAYTQAYASFGVRCMVGGDIPNNAGSLDPIRVTAPENSILNAPRPRAVSARHAIGQMLPDVVLGCLAQALEGGAPAEGAGCIFNPVFLGGEGVAPSAQDAPFVTNPVYCGGTGARIGKDGLSTTAFPSGVKNTPVEILETTSPLLVWRKEYRCDSGGAGTYRGGLGQIIEIAHAEGEPFWISKMFDRVQHPPLGRQDGLAGAPAKVYVKDGRVLRGMGRELIGKDETLVIETTGGGGVGDPRGRSKKNVHDDILNGFVSKTAASALYDFDQKD